jgi:hypothetical protein
VNRREALTGILALPAMTAGASGKLSSAPREGWYLEVGRFNDQGEPFLEACLGPFALSEADELLVKYSPAVDLLEKVAGVPHGTYWYGIMDRKRVAIKPVDDTLVEC